MINEDFEIKRERLSEEEALHASTNAFIDWYTSGKPGNLNVTSFDDFNTGTKRKIKIILEELRMAELGELIAFFIFKKNHYLPIYSNIHLKSSLAFATSVDMIVENNNKYFFAEVKTPVKPTKKNISNNIRRVLEDIDGRLENIEKSVGLTELDIEDEELISSKWGGVGAIISINGDEIKVKNQKKLIFLIEIKGNKKIEEDILNKLKEKYGTKNNWLNASKE